MRGRLAPSLRSTSRVRTQVLSRARARPSGTGRLPHLGNRLALSSLRRTELRRRLGLLPDRPPNSLTLTHRVSPLTPFRIKETRFPVSQSPLRAHLLEGSLRVGRDRVRPALELEAGHMRGH